jgi:hypothetical protein
VDLVAQIPEQISAELLVETLCSLQLPLSAVDQAMVLALHQMVQELAVLFKVQVVVLQQVETAAVAAVVAAVAAAQVETVEMVLVQQQEVLVMDYQIQLAELVQLMEQAVQVQMEVLTSAARLVQQILAKAVAVAAPVPHHLAVVEMADLD